MLTSKTVNNDQLTSSTTTTGGSGDIDPVSPTVLVTSTSGEERDTRSPTLLSTDAVSHLASGDDNYQEGVASEHTSTSNTGGNNSSASSTPKHELIASTETDKLEELGAIRIPVSERNLGRHKRESFTFVPRPTSEDVVSVHGSFPDDNARGPIASGSPQQYSLPTEETDPSQLYDQYGTYIHVRNRINDNNSNSNNNNMLADTRHEYTTGSDGDDRSRSHATSTNLTVRTRQCEENDDDDADASNEEDDANVNASTVFIHSPRSPHTMTMDDDDDDDDADVVDLVNVPRVHVDRTHIDHGFTNAGTLPDVEDILPGWQDAIRKASTPNGTATTGTIKLPTNELVSTVYDVAADLNRRLSNWWHSHRLEGMPQDLTQIDQAVNAIESDEASSVKQSDSQSLDATDTMNISKVTDPELTAPPSAPYSTTYRHVWLLGKRYNVITELPRNFRLDFYSRIWCTYRSEFENIGETSYTSDAGWGCMLRTGQSLFAQALLFHHLGRDWRCGPMDPSTMEKYTKIISWFHDDTISPFSLHNIATLGEKHGKRIGEWFGPFTVANVLCQLNEQFPESGLRIHVASDGVIYRDLIPGASKQSSDTSCHKPSLLSTQLAQHLARVESTANASSSGEFKPTLILLAIRLGIDELNPIYHPAVKMCLAFPQSVGIAGGRPSASLYFMGFDGDDLFYLDPHCTRTAISKKSPNDYSEEDLASYHCPRPRSIRIHRLDPSMLIGFYCRDRQDFDDLCQRTQWIGQLGTPLFSVEPSAPVYGEDTEVISASDSESIV